MIKEKTHHYPFALRMRFRYYEWKELGGNRSERITRLWWKPIMWLGTKEWFRYIFGISCDKWTWWVRKHITYD